MPRVRWSGWFCLTLTLIVFAQATMALAQPPRTRGPGVETRFRVDREREAERPPADRREGGIPRAVIAPQEEPVGPEGTLDGMPQLQLERERDGRRISPQWLPPDRRGRWQLGIFARNTDTGVVVTRVLQRSAARRAGIEPGDVIVAIRGFQVGWVEDRLYPLGDELQRQADRAGFVSLLVQNVRNRRLVNIPVQLDRVR
jgi:hypothetical protein